MIKVDTVGEIGGVRVDTQEFQGHPPEYWAQSCTEKICGISESAAPHIRQQAEAFRVAIYNTILYYIQQSINSERCTIYNVLIQQGHEDLAKIFRGLK